MKWDKNNPVLPIDLCGSQLREVRYDDIVDGKTDDGHDIHNMCPNLKYSTDRNRYYFKPFNHVEMTLRYNGYARYGHSISFVFLDSDNHEFYMSLTDMDAILNNGLSVKELSGRFTACKRGERYGIKLDNIKY